MKYDIVFHNSYVIFREDHDGKRWIIGHARTWDEAISAIRGDAGRPVLIHVEAIEPVTAQRTTAPHE